MSSRRLLLATLAALALPAALAAQDTSPVAPAASAPLPSPHAQVLSVQPLSAMFTVYSGELERRLTRSVTLGVGGTYWGKGSDDTGVDYSSGDVKLRYYPSGTPFRGFSFGGQAGYARLAGRMQDADTGESRQGSVGGPSFGIALDYSWLLGASQSFYVGLGVGAKAVVVDTDEFVGSVTARYPTARIAVGVAF